MNLVKDDFLWFLFPAKLDGKSVVAYGAAAKGDTLMNYAGVRPELIAYVVDRATSKRGKFMLGSRIPIEVEESLEATRPDHDSVVTMPWNQISEIVRQLDYIWAWGGQFVTAVPGLEIAA